MQLKFYGYNTPAFGDQTYITPEQMQGVDIDFSLVLPNVNGFNLEPVKLDGGAERRNGLPINYNLYGFDGAMHVFPLYNSSAQDVNIMLQLYKLPTVPFLYLFGYDVNGVPFYDAKTTAIMKVINPLHPASAGIRVVVNDIQQAGNNGIGANKEFDINYSVYGTWNNSGLITFDS